MRRVYIFFIMLPGLCLAQDNNERCLTLTKIYDLINQEHYKPRAVDDSLAVYVFDEFMDVLDGNRIVITKEEYHTLLKYRPTLDDHIRNVDCSFMDAFVSIYINALSRKKNMIEKLRSKPLNYQSGDTVHFSKTRFDFDLSVNDLDRVWNKRLRFEILEDIAKKSRNKDSLWANFTTMEKIARDKIFETNICRVNSEVNSNITSDLWKQFLNIFCSYFDPHSSYFPMEAKSSFISSLSTSNLSLGISVGLNEHEEIVIEEIFPGGPADLTQKIDKNDVIVSVSDQKGQEHRVSCESLDLVGEFLFSDLNKVLDLTLRKKNGTLLQVSMEKVVMQANGNTVCGLIAEYEGVRAGYIAIPNFYSNFEPGSTAGCSDDVAREIYKLNQHEIDGLIIDLQGNGGGSMDEAIRLAGMFVEGGALSILADRYGNQTVLKDMSRGIVYDGPLVILIDGTSASASEFFASAMQDYGRAIIVGSPSLGKATMQTIIGLDGEDSNDFVKMTVQKFYRITGESAQEKGVIPDVRFPVLFEDIVHREAKHPTSLPHEVIHPKAAYSRYYQPNSIRAISSARKRVEKSAVMKDLSKLNAKINTAYNLPAKSVLLTFEGVFAHQHDTDALWDEVHASTASQSEAEISNTQFQIEKIKIDTFENDMNNLRLEGARSNPYLQEIISIIRDLKGK